MAQVRNLYQIPQGYVFDPFDVLYNSPDPEEVGLQPFAEELRDYALLMDENIAGDFNLDNMIYEIQENKLSFVRNGLIGFKIKFFKLYEKTHKSFQDFCEKALGMSHWYMNRLMEAARVVLKLALNGFTTLPTCEAQARPLVKLHDDDLCDKWEEVIDTIPAHKITTERIKEVLGEPSSLAFIRVSKELKAKLEVKAGTYHMNLQKYLDAICEDEIESSTEEVDEEQIKHWQEDLENLTQEYEESQQAHKEEGAEYTSQQESCKTVPIVTDDENIEEKVEEVETHHEADSKSIHPDNQLDENVEVSEENLESLTLEYDETHQDNKEEQKEHSPQQKDSKTVPIVTNDKDIEEKLEELEPTQDNDSESIYPDNELDEEVENSEENCEPLTQEYDETHEDNKEEQKEHSPQQENSETVPIGTKNQSEVKVETEVKSSQSDDSEPSSSET